eukprot:2358096-Pyramimonas_sp.AAC.1
MSGPEGPAVVSGDLGAPTPSRRVGGRCIVLRFLQHSAVVMPQSRCMGPNGPATFWVSLRGVFGRLGCSKVASVCLGMFSHLGGHVGPSG